MLDVLTAFYSAVYGLTSDPRVLAAMSGMVVSILFGRWRDTVLVGVLAFIFTPIILHNPLFSAPAEWSPGFGGALAIWGVHGISDRINQLDIKYLISTVVEQIKGKR